MPIPKLEYILQKMPVSECEGFRHQLLDSRRKKEQSLGKLLQLILQDELDQEAMYKELYPDKDYSAKQMRNLRSELFNRLTDFLATRLFEASPDRHLYLARAYNRIHATRYIPALLEKYTVEERGDKLSIDLAELDLQMQEEEMKSQYIAHGRRDMSFQTLMEGKEEVFVARMLHHALASHESSKIIQAGDKKAPSLLLWPHIQEQLQNGAWRDSPLIRLYYGLYLLVTSEPDPQRFRMVRSALSEYGHHLTRAEALHMYTPALNYCIRNLNKGDHESLVNAFHLYREMIERSLLITPDGINPWHFKSLVAIGLRLREIEWVRDFVEQNHLYLATEFHTNLLQYCRGLIAFRSGEFEAAEHYMNKVLEDFSDPFYGLDARSYLLRIYYETGNETGMVALETSFRLFLRRHRHLGADRLGNYREFIRFFRRLHALPPGDHRRAERLHQEIDASTYHAGRDWLLEKLSPLLNRGKPGRN